MGPQFLHRRKPPRETVHAALVARPPLARVTVLLNSRVVVVGWARCWQGGPQLPARDEARESPIPVRVRELQQRATDGLHRRLLRAKVELKEAQTHLSDQLTQRRDQVSQQYNRHVTHIKHQWQVSSLSGRLLVR